MTSLMISESKTPFIRGGRSNMVWPVLAIGVLIFINAMTLPEITRFAIGGFLLLTISIGLRMYVTTVAQVVFLDDRIHVSLAVYEREVRYDTIEVVQIVRLRLTPLLRIRIRSRLTGRLLQVSIPGPFTPWGSLKECSARLAKEFQAKGVQAIER
jgi:hypothetical protein